MKLHDDGEYDDVEQQAGQREADLTMTAACAQAGDMRQVSRQLRAGSYIPPASPAMVARARARFLRYVAASRDVA